jgi:hypothetical protein
MTIVDMSKRIGINVTRIVDYCYRQRKKTNGEMFNLSTRYYNKRWSERSLEYLSDNIGLKSFGEISNEIRRSPSAIKHRIRKKRMSLYSNFYTCRSLGKELGRDKDVILKWANKGLIPYKRAAFKGRYGTTPYVFLESDIVKFLRSYYYKFSPHKIEHPYFKNIVIKQYELSKGAS